MSDPSGRNTCGRTATSRNYGSGWPDSASARSATKSPNISNTPSATRITRPFQPTDDEHKFYEAVSAFLLRDDTYSIPVRQRTLTTLILRKLLASSSHAIAGTLETMKERLEKIRDGLPAEENLAEQIIALEELEDDYLDEELDLPECRDWRSTRRRRRPRLTSHG